MTLTVEKQTMYAGEKKVLRFTVIDKDTVGEPPLDLTPFVVRWTLSRLTDSGYSSTPTVSKSTTTSGVVKTNPVAGVCEVTLLRVDTEAISLGGYHQELELVDGLGELAVVAVGDIDVLRNVVNP